MSERMNTGPASPIARSERQEESGDISYACDMWS